jgi:hypothetical protein
MMLAVHNEALRLLVRSSYRVDAGAGDAAAGDAGGDAAVGDAGAAAADAAATDGFGLAASA